MAESFSRNLKALLRRQIKEALEQAGASGPTNVASATNVSSSGRSTSVYSDSKVTVIRRDGETQVIRHDQPDGFDGQADGEQPNDSSSQD